MLFLDVVVMTSGGGPWWNYPGFELWKFVNLAVFVGVAVYIHRRLGRPIRQALRSRAERIKLELRDALAERDNALRRLQEVEARLSRLDEEVALAREQARLEADAESERIKRTTEAETTKLREQGQREIETAAKVAKQELRRFAAEQSTKLAEESIRRELTPQDDSRLIDMGVDQIGRGIH